MEQIHKDIADIKEAMRLHNIADDRRFDEIIQSNKQQTVVLSEIQTSLAPISEWFGEMTLGKRIKWEWVTSTSKIGGVILVIVAVLGAMWAGIKYLILNAIR